MELTAATLRMQVSAAYVDARDKCAFSPDALESSSGGESRGAENHEQEGETRDNLDELEGKGAVEAEADEGQSERRRVEQHGDKPLEVSVAVDAKVQDAKGGDGDEAEEGEGEEGLERL